MGACISFDISKTSCYVTASVALKMELSVQITQIKWLSVKISGSFTIMVRESANLNATVSCEGD